jgi:hypothetical protein
MTNTDSSKTNELALLTAQFAEAAMKERGAEPSLVAGVLIGCGIELLRNVRPVAEVAGLLQSLAANIGDPDTDPRRTTTH